MINKPYSFLSFSVMLYRLLLLESSKRGADILQIMKHYTHLTYNSVHGESGLSMSRVFSQISKLSSSVNLFPVAKLKHTVIMPPERRDTQLPINMLTSNAFPKNGKSRISSNIKVSYINPLQMKHQQNNHCV